MSNDNAGETETAVEQLSENTVEYMLFVVENQQPEARKARTSLETIRKAAVELVQSLTKDYIWQREGFEISLKSEHGEFPTAAFGCPTAVSLTLDLTTYL